MCLLRYLKIIRLGIQMLRVEPLSTFHDTVQLCPAGIWNQRLILPRRIFVIEPRQHLPSSKTCITIDLCFRAHKGLRIWSVYLLQCIHCYRWAHRPPLCTYTIWIQCYKHILRYLYFMCVQRYTISGLWI